MDRLKIEKKYDSNWVEIFLRYQEEDLTDKRLMFGRDHGAKHVCPVLKILWLRTYLYEISNDVDLEEVREILDGVLFVNQNISQVLCKELNLNAAFPDYFDQISDDIKIQCYEEAETYQGSKMTSYDLRPYYLKIKKIIEKFESNENLIRMIEHCDYGIYLGTILVKEAEKIGINKFIPDENRMKSLEAIGKKFRLGMSIRKKIIYEYLNNGT